MACSDLNEARRTRRGDGARVWLFTLFAGLVGALHLASAYADPLAVQSLSPATGAQDVCPDSPLRIRFASAPIAGAGRIVICDAANDAAVDTIAVDSPTRVQTIGGLPN